MKGATADFNYHNMENELLNTVMEDENMAGIPQNLMPYEEDDFEGEPEGEPTKQWGKLAVSLVISVLLFGGLLYVLRRFPTEYSYGKTDTEYQNCLRLMSDGDYEAAGKSADLLLKQDKVSLAYLALRNIACEKTDDKETQLVILQQIVDKDPDNYLAYKQLLQLYLDQDAMPEIAELAKNAPNSIIASMFKPYLIDAPYLELTPGNYDYSQVLVISAKSGYDIFYTVDGSSPMESGVPYTGPITLESGHYTVVAVCRNDKKVYSEEETGEYQIGLDTAQGVVQGMPAGVGTGSLDQSGPNAEDPTVSSDSSSGIEQPQVYPQSGTYTTPQRIVIDVPIGYKAYYSWSTDRTLTPENGTAYQGGITMPEGSSVLSVIVTDGNGNSSSVIAKSKGHKPEGYYALLKTNIFYVT